MSKNEVEMNQAMIVKLAYERYENYIATARAIIHFHKTDGATNNPPYDSLWHILDLMSSETQSLTDTVDRQMDSIMSNEHSKMHS